MIDLSFLISGSDKIVTESSEQRIIRINSLIIDIQKELDELKIKLADDKVNLQIKKLRDESLKNINCRHFAIDSNRFLKPEDIHRIVKPIMGIDNYKVKRIIKSYSNYLRLSFKKSVDKDIAVKTITALRVHFDAKIKELSLKVNKTSRNMRHYENTSILTLNINHIKNKLEELSFHLRKHRPTIICLQETGRLATERHIHINGYRIEEIPVGEKGLGMLIGIRKDVNLIPKIIEKTENLILFSVKNRDTNLVIGNIYRRNSGNERKATYEKVVKLFDDYKDENLILLGDWNTEANILLKRLEKDKIEAFTNNLPKRGTRVKRNQHRTIKVIDFAIANHDKLIISHHGKRNWNLSDHVPIEVRIENTHKSNTRKRRVIFDKDLLKNKRVIKKICFKEYKNSSDAAESIRLLSQETKDELKSLKVIREESILEKKEYISTKLKRLIKEKREVSNLVQKNLLPESNFKKIKAMVKLEILNSRRRNYVNFISKGTEILKNHDYRNAWRFIMLHTGSNKKMFLPNMVLNNNVLVNEPKEVLEVWKNHFKSLCTKCTNEKTYNCIVERNMTIETITDSPIEWNEIVQELKCTRNHKAAGDDNIPSDFYKILQIEELKDSNFAKALLIGLNKVYEESICPKEWENCTVVPVYKKGNEYDPNNYRGIALINTMQKILAKILAKRMQSACTDFNLLIKEQAGFIREGECASQIVSLLECCQRRKFNHKDTYLLFLDLKKAYDMVPHKRLIEKMRKFQFGPKLIRFIESMYQNTYMRVKVGTQLSESFKYERGVRQGCPTSPILFNIYINDILDRIRPIEVEGLCHGFRGLMFADDTVIAAESLEDLNNKIKIIQEWMSENSMEINPSKCGVMLVKEGIVNIPEIKYNNEIIPNVNSYTYLGVEFNDQLDLELMAGLRQRKGIAMSNTLGPTLRNNKIPLEYKRMLISNILIPTLSYGTEVFGMSEKRSSQLKKTVDISIGLVLKNKMFCRNRAYEEFDLKPIQLRAALNRTRGYFKWKNSYNIIKSLIHTAEDFKARKRTWTTGTRTWLKKFKIDLNSNSGQKEVLKDYQLRIEKREHSLISKNAKDWKLSSGKLLRKLEVSKKLNSNGAMLLTKLRTGTFMFTNNYVYSGKIPPEYKNKCICCQTRCIENTEHLMLKCSAFDEERVKFLNVNRAIFVSGNGPNFVRGKLRETLGGVCPASGMKRADRIVNTINYLSAISRKRNAVVGNLLRRTTM